MRVNTSDNGFSGQAIAGSYVVTLGMDMDQSEAQGLLGFAIERSDETENEQYWLKGMKSFEESSPHLPPGSLISTLEQPIQGFRWGDYTAKPNHEYKYKIVALYGKPKKLEQRHTIELEVSTENEDDGTHAVYFNRGVAASQAYAREFKNLPPDQVPNRAALVWLSRGLEEALLAFIGQAKDKSYGLRAAVYEFDYAPVLDALAAAKKRGADVKVVFDAKKNSTSDPRNRNIAAIAAAGIGDLAIKREANSSAIAHNKFVVLLKNKKPIALWTGSTNITEGAIFGHSNVGHIVRDPKVAQAYLNYWTQLSGDPEAQRLRPWDDDNSPSPKGAPAVGCVPIYSPRGSLDALQWYADRMDQAEDAVFFTAAFGINQKFDQVLQEKKGYLRYGLLEKTDGTVDLLRRDPDNLFAYGSLIDHARQNGGALESWLNEKLTGLNKHVQYIHTKYMLIDPLSESPTVISGSANFSDASTTKNDENMIVVQDDKRVADIYLGEFMRLFDHFQFRDLVARQTASSTSGGDPGYLAPTDAWTAPYYASSSYRELERRLFAGTGNGGRATAGPGTGRGPSGRAPKKGGGPQDAGATVRKPQKKKR